METIILSAVIAFFFQLDQKKRYNLKHYLVQFVFIACLLFVMDKAATYFDFNLPFSDRVPESYKILTGGIVFFILCCGLSYLSWRNYKENKVKKTESK